MSDFTWEEREDGLFCRLQGGRGVAHVQTREVGETNDPRLRVQERTVKELPATEWRVHFCGGKFSPAEVKELARELAEKGG